MDGYQIKTKPNDLDPEIDFTFAVNPNGHYIGNPETAAWLCDERGIAPELASPNHGVCSIGFCEKEQKWYGWSHRAIFGFGVGSKVAKGDCAYVPDNPEELIEEHANWLDGKDAEQRRAECQILEDRSGIRILHSPFLIEAVASIDDLAAAMEGEDHETETVDLHGGENAVSIQKCGRGEWVAQNLEDAKQMAIDFAESVG
ncbi:MAG: hypothetical protein AAGB23_05405 [Pseudomonadota bacterium]